MPMYIIDSKLKGHKFELKGVEIIKPITHQSESCHKLLRVDIQRHTGLTIRNVIAWTYQSMLRHCLILHHVFEYFDS